MKRFHMLLCALLLFTVISGCNAAKQDGGKKNIELTVSAAVSLKAALEEIRDEFEKENKHINIHFNFGASGTLQQQIIQGAPVDLFFSATEDKFDLLVKDDIIETRRNLLGNEIVLIVPKQSNLDIHSFDGLGNASKIAIGTPEVVPAGEYAHEALKSMGLWNKVEPKIIFAKDVRQALTYVESGNVDAGIVYRTDAKHSKNTEIASEAPHGSHSAIIYPMGILKNTKHPKDSERFYDYLQGEKAMDIFKKFGFKGLD
ncbi:molybdate ABC transporter substrate-binding protein [Peribacillus glennii]|uniref:Molybdate ABC transporter substrate-binding protein n=1 Tax=Peribacillus glennii TaxID=2303991 RepID=A0A372L9Y7_9BACI|nr:molybdate ABC transporter substrate-binding protein [Peribacillus glennii]RFU62039.1 molybdate ABC transporter substrate-binding protein [Peribacillus glennii]